MEPVNKDRVARPQLFYQAGFEDAKRLAREGGILPMSSEPERGAPQTIGGEGSISVDTKQDSLRETIRKLKLRLAKAENEAALDGGMLRAMTNLEMLPVHRDTLMKVLGFAIDQVAAGTSQRGMIAWDLNAKCARHPKTPVAQEVTFGVQAVVQHDFQERGVFSTKVIMNPNNPEVEQQSLGGSIAVQS